MLVVLALGMALSCNKGKVIPKSDFKHIYAEMFMADALLAEIPNMGRTADTSAVYESIYRKYGYTTKDYQASLQEYMKDPMRFSRTLKQAVQIIDENTKELEALKKIVDAQTERVKALSAFRPEAIYFPSRLDRGSHAHVMHAFKDSVLMDKVVYIDSCGGSWNFELEPFSLVVGVDSLAFGVDSLAFGVDSLAVAAPAVVDSAVVDAVGSAGVAPAAEGEKDPAIPAKPVRRAKNLKLNNE